MKRMFSVLFALAAFAAQAQESKAIRCEFTSQPDGANVIVDDVTRGVTPITLYDLGPGKHHVRFELQNYEIVDEFLFLREGGFSQKNAVLNPIKGLLLLTSEPSGCDISLDGMSLGRTPRLIASLDAKDVYRLLLQKPGYQPRTVEVRFSGRTPLVRDEELIIDSGVIEVTSDPAGATVTVNGQPRGNTPVTVREVPKGRATVTLKKHGFDEETRELSIVAGESQTLFVKMNGLPGTMSLTSVPDGARFYVNDQPHGKGPVSLTNLNPGNYTIRVEKEGFATATKTVMLTVKPGVTTQPKSVTIAAGGTAQFVVGAAGTNLSYQWQQLSGGSWVDLPTTNTAYTGVTSHVMTVKAIAARNGFKYRCFITGDNGATASATVTLTVT